MTAPVVTSTATTTRILVAWPEGRRVRGRVKELDGLETYPAEVHPDKPHRWREVLHFGKPGTGFVMCPCGAYGVPYRKGAT